MLKHDSIRKLWLMIKDVSLEIRLFSTIVIGYRSVQTVVSRYT